MMAPSAYKGAPSRVSYAQRLAAIEYASLESDSHSDGGDISSYIEAMEKIRTIADPHTVHIFKGSRAFPEISQNLRTISNYLVFSSDMGKFMELMETFEHSVFVSMFLDRRFKPNRKLILEILIRACIKSNQAESSYCNQTFLGKLGKILCKKSQISPLSVPILKLMDQMVTLFQKAFDFFNIPQHSTDIFQSLSSMIDSCDKNLLYSIAIFLHHILEGETRNFDPSDLVCCIPEKLFAIQEPQYQLLAMSILSRFKAVPNQFFDIVTKLFESGNEDYLEKCLLTYHRFSDQWGSLFTDSLLDMTRAYIGILHYDLESLCVVVYSEYYRFGENLDKDLDALHVFQNFSDDGEVISMILSALMKCIMVYYSQNRLIDILDEICSFKSKIEAGISEAHSDSYQRVAEAILRLLGDIEKMKSDA